MSKSVNFVIGTAIGIAVGALVGYVLAPARDTAMDATYRSRLDKALAEGRQAAALREAELREEFLRAKRRHTPGSTAL